MKDILSTLEEELGLPKGKIHLEDCLGFCEWWDSLNHIIVLLTVAALAKVELTPEAAESLTSIKAIVRFLDETKGIIDDAISCENGPSA